MLNRIRHLFKGHQWEKYTAFPLNMLYSNGESVETTVVVQRCKWCNVENYTVLPGNQMIAFEHIANKAEIDELNRMAGL